LGQTVNVSRTGVLFTGVPGTVAVGARMQFVLALPSMGHLGSSRVQCEGQVVRQCRSAATGESATAATIDHYEFLGITTASAPGLEEVGVE